MLTLLHKQRRLNTYREMRGYSEEQLRYVPRANLSETSFINPALVFVNLSSRYTLPLHHPHIWTSASDSTHRRG